MTAAQPTLTTLSTAQAVLQNANAEVAAVEETIFGPLEEGSTTNHLGGGLQDIASDKQVLEIAAIAAFGTATDDQAAAASADSTAQATLTAYNAALALDVEVKASMH